MNDKKILAALNELEPAETAYRELYLANPYDNIPPVRDWEDFATEYKKNMKRGCREIDSSEQGEERLT